MLATLTYNHFSDPAWIFEPKLDGERCLASRRGPGVRLFSRNQKLLNEEYPELVEALAGQRSDGFIVDGEVVAFKGDVTSFSQLQQRMHRRPTPALMKMVPVYYYIFDAVYMDGYDTTGLRLRRRKELLEELLTFHDPLRYTDHRNREGEAYLEEACRRGWEGLIAKRADSAYVQRRSRDWLKFKCFNEQEFVIIGFTDPKGSRVGLGSLLLGYYEGEKVVYAGRVGTGFDTETLRRLYEELSSIERSEPTVDSKEVPRRGVHWVEPKLVAQCAFTEWTHDGRLRHPRFLGLRRDKDPREVVRERP
jgi:DNA ligase D-like protein (predicted ligase)